MDEQSGPNDWLVSNLATHKTINFSYVDRHIFHIHFIHHLINLNFCNPIYLSRHRKRTFPISYTK